LFEFVILGIVFSKRSFGGSASVAELILFFKAELWRISERSGANP